MSHDCDIRSVRAMQRRDDDFDAPYLDSPERHAVDGSRARRDQLRSETGRTLAVIDGFDFWITSRRDSDRQKRSLLR